MQNEKISIIILEDDETLGSALKEAFSREGHSVQLFARPDEARNFILTNKIDYLFCDCMLPQMTGTSFVAGLKENNKNLKFKTVLMSGIYTDKLFIQEATKQTEAIAFLMKPFDLKEVLKLVKPLETASKSVTKEDTSTRKLLYQVFSNPNITPRQKRKLIESIEEVSGFDLPFIYSMLVETKSSGYLNIYHSDGAVSGVSFSSGNIVTVDVQDEKTYIGEMLIQAGYATPEDIQAAVKNKNERRLGAYLVQASLISPHALDLALTEQMNIRLSKTIDEKKIRINFAATEVELTQPFIDSESLMDVLHDWIASKVNINWLKSLYMMWGGYVIAPAPTFSATSSAFQSFLIKSLDGIVEKINNRMSLQQLLAAGYNETALYKGIHFLLTRGQVIFEQKASAQTVEEQKHNLQKIYSDISALNDFQMLEYMESCTFNSGNSQVLFNEFIALIGEMPDVKHLEANSLWNKIREKAQKSIDSVSDEKRNNQFREAAAKHEAEAKFKANHLMEEIKKALYLNQYSKALDLIADVTALAPQIAQLKLFSAWAKLGSFDPARKAIMLKEIELEILQIPPDEKYDAYFPFIMGLFSKVKGDIAGAKKYFEKSMGLDPGFIVARRELSIIDAGSKKQDLLNMDLKDVVSGFFKKR